MTMPIRHRNTEVHEQVSKAKEITGSLILSGINILVIGALTGLTMENRNCRSLTNCSDSRVEFVLLAIVPALISHLAGCGLLAIYYYFCHPWKKVFREQNAEVREHSEGKA